MRNRRPGRVTQPPSIHDEDEFVAWLHRLAIYVEELGGKVELPDGEARNLLGYRASGTAAQTGWRAYHADNFGYCEVTSRDAIEEL